MIGYLNFQKWWKEKGIDSPTIYETTAAMKAWEARQPEIDALKTENRKLAAMFHEKVDECANYNVGYHRLQSENAALKSTISNQQDEIFKFADEARSLMEEK